MRAFFRGYERNLKGLPTRYLSLYVVILLFLEQSLVLLPLVPLLALQLWLEGVEKRKQRREEKLKEGKLLENELQE